MKQIRIGIIQPKIFFDKRKSYAENDLKNYKHALKLLSRFKRNEVDLIIFPEMYPGEATLQVAEMKEMKNEARRLRAYIIAGELYRKEGKKYNSAAIISPSGKIIGRHYKLNLWLGEKGRGHIAGKSLRIFRVKKIKIGILICHDFQKLIFSRKLMKKGAELLIVPSNSVPAFLKYWNHDLIYTSYRFLVPIVYVNNVLIRGPFGNSGGGLSKIVAPFKKILSFKEMRLSTEPLVDPKNLVVLKLGKKEAVVKYKLNLEPYNKFRKSRGY